MPQAIRVLNVAEKPSVAKEVSRILSNGNNRQGQSCSRFNPVWEFPYSIGSQPCDMTFTSVSGHLMEMDFDDAYRRWHSVDPVELYTAPMHKFVPESKADLERNLKQAARRAQWLLLWLDCDREGENIGFEVLEVCRAANPGLVVKRARFSALVHGDLSRAVQNLVAPDAAASAAVDARQEIDLRIGASFTRFQTLLLQKKFNWVAAGLDERPLISYGPCQFPTLGLIVQRAWQIASHVKESFWEIVVEYSEAGGKRCSFKWERGHLFDHAAAVAFFQPCVMNPTASVLAVNGVRKENRAPVPLATLDMQKRVTRELRMPGEAIMKIAEELYQAGFISYPRTETDGFSQDYDLMSMCRQHSGDQRWGAHAGELVDGTMFCFPGNGGHDDQAHPPIHPTRYTAGESGWSPEKKRLYEFIVRHFLACCSKAAVGFETKVAVDIAGERFMGTGLMVTERNWLEVYPYASWGGNANLPAFQQGQQFIPQAIELRQAWTQAPPRLMESSLIGLMERHGIGTDATVAEHIQKQLDRGYAEKDSGMAFMPTPLGEALVSGYRDMGLSNLWTPDLRAQIERNISLVAQSRRTKAASHCCAIGEVLQEAVDTFKASFQEALRRAPLLERQVARHFAPAAGRSASDGDAIGPCAGCGRELLLCRQGDFRFVECSGSPLCSVRTYFPGALSEAAVSDQQCQSCGHGTVKLLDLRFRRLGLPPGFEPVMAACIICGTELKRLLAACGPVRPPAAGNGGGGGRGRGSAGAPAGGRGTGNRGGGVPTGAKARGAAAGARGAGGRSVARGNGGGGGATAGVRRRRQDDDNDEEGAGPRAQRGRTAGRAPASTRGGTRGGGSRGGSRGGGRGGGRGGIPLCPNHHQECLERTSRSANNPGRKCDLFYKCAHPSEAEDCLTFAWADEFDSSAGRGSGRGGAAGGAPARGTRGGRHGRAAQEHAAYAANAAGSHGISGAGNFVAATGHSLQQNGGSACFKCGEHGHWSRDCPAA